jgi:hypothetical protein
LNKNLNLNEQAQEILRIAEKYGVESNFFFITTFKRYSNLLKYLTELEETIAKEGLMVTKTYIKGAGNKSVHPALAMYNKTCAEANKTVSSLMRIIKELRNNEKNGEPDPLLEYLGGRIDTIL